MYMTNFCLVGMWKTCLTHYQIVLTFCQARSWQTWTSIPHHWMDSQYVHIFVSVTVTKIWYFIREEKKFTLVCSDGHKSLNMSSCAFYFKKFWFQRETIFNLSQNIRCCNQCSIFNICLKYKFSLMVTNCQKFQYSALIAKKMWTVRFLMSKRNFSQGKIFTCFIKAVVLHHVGS